MATFRTGQKTNPTVLPQQPALELWAADTPRIRNETGSQRRDAAPGAGHGRGEISGGAPATGNVTPAPSRAGERHPAVFVFDKHGTPLQPTTPARARKLLKSARAVVTRYTPFVIRLKDRTVAGSEVDGVEVGIDPGSRCPKPTPSTHCASANSTPSPRPRPPLWSPDAPDAAHTPGHAPTSTGSRAYGWLGKSSSSASPPATSSAPSFRAASTQGPTPAGSPSEPQAAA
ncbi:RRXRR domain-containing protein [Actinoallomurus iriomotensis]|uniref:RRXRR domain-containing protein n=1 Tax=Actinoallomurus iriomotensis TaxID=478107 RepID=UPI003D7FB857